MLFIGGVSGPGGVSGRGVSGPGGCSPNFRRWGVVPPNFRGGGSPPEYSQRSAGTHPTGMHSCFTRRLYLYE